VIVDLDLVRVPVDHLLVDHFVQVELVLFLPVDACLFVRVEFHAHVEFHVHVDFVAHDLDLVRVLVDRVLDVHLVELPQCIEQLRGVVSL